MDKPTWEIQPLSSEDWGPSPLEDLVDMWVKLLAINLGHVEKPKFYYISTEWLDSPLNCYTVSFPEGIKVSIFHPNVKDGLLAHAIENGWEPVDYQEYCKTEGYKQLFEKEIMRKLTLLTKVSHYGK